MAATVCFVNSRTRSLQVHHFRSLTPCSVLPPPTLLIRRSAAGRAAVATSADRSADSSDTCWPIAQRLLDSPVKHQPARRAQEHRP